MHSLLFAPFSSTIPHRFIQASEPAGIIATTRSQSSPFPDVTVGQFVPSDRFSTGILAFHAMEDPAPNELATGPQQQQQQAPATPAQPQPQTRLDGTPIGQPSPIPIPGPAAAQATDLLSSLNTSSISPNGTLVLNVSPRQLALVTDQQNAIKLPNYNPRSAHALLSLFVAMSTLESWAPRHPQTARALSTFDP